MNTIIDALRGKKTYLLAFAAVVYAVAGYASGNLDAKSAMDVVWAALTSASMRAAISKASY
jgi:hypothetical protein